MRHALSIVGGALLTTHRAHPANIQELTALRFFAAMWVVIYHFRRHLGLDLDRISHVFELGYLGVDLFFVLSGFILFHVYYRDYAQGRFKFRRFIVNRFARLYPIHLATLLVAIAIIVTAIVMGVPTTVGLDPLAILLNLTLLHGWGFPETFVGINAPSWSISTEWFAYLLFPVFLAVGHRLWKRPATFVALSLTLFVISIEIVAAIFDTQVTRLSDRLPQFRIVPEFMLGGALYCASCKLTLKPGVAMTATLVALTAWGLSVHFGLNDHALVLLQALLVFLIAQVSKHDIRWPLRWSVLVYLGETSYSLYMVHRPIEMAYFKSVEVFFKQPEALPFIYWIPAFVLTQIAATFGYHLIERPGRTYLRRLSIFRHIRVRF